MDETEQVVDEDLPHGCLDWRDAFEQMREGRKEDRKVAIRRAQIGDHRGNTILWNTLIDIRDHANEAAIVRRAVKGLQQMQDLSLVRDVCPPEWLQ